MDILMVIAVILSGIGFVTIAVVVFSLQVQINKLKLDLQRHIFETNRIETMRRKPSNKPRDGQFPFDEIITVKNPINTIKTSVNEVINNVKK